jgi:hypothetical protein
LGGKETGLEEVKIFNKTTRNTEPLKNLGFDEREIEEIDTFILTSFFIKYEQANFLNIHKTSKFVNAVKNFIDQTLISKKFKNQFSQINEPNAVE